MRINIMVPRKILIALIIAVVLAVAGGTYWQSTNNVEAQIGDKSAIEIESPTATPSPLNDGSVDYRFTMVFTTTPTTYTELVINITTTDGPLAIRIKKTNAVQDYAAGAGITVPRSRIILYELERGL